MTVPADVAAAIRALVLPASLIANSGPMGRCPCQYGPCQSCLKGRHKGCTHRRHAPNPPHPHTWVTNAGGLTVSGPAGNVWTVGRPCQWVCTCPTCNHPRPEAAEVPAPGNPPARPRAIWQAIALIPDAPAAQAPAPARGPARPKARPRPKPDDPTLF